MRIITISREFGSGGRELGKRLAEYLGYDYYDREIINSIAENCGVNADYAEYMLSHSFPPTVSITMRQSLHMPEIMQSSQIQLLRAQTDVIKSIAAKGRDCVIVGRNADMLLAEYQPFNIFVCADVASKMQRCAERAEPDEKVTAKEMLAKMKQIDKNRAKTREMISDTSWGDRKTYHLIINTSGWDLKKLTPHIGAIVSEWFGSAAHNV